MDRVGYNPGSEWINNKNPGDVAHDAHGSEWINKKNPGAEACEAHGSETINDKHPGSEATRTTFTHGATFENPMPPNIFSKIVHRLKSINSTPPPPRSSLGTLSARASTKDKVDTLKHVQSRMLELVQRIDENPGANDSDCHTLGELVMILSGKLRAGTLADKRKLGSNVAEKAVKRLLSVLDPTVLKSLSTNGKKSYTIAPQLDKSIQINRRFGPLCRQLVKPEHRTAALADLARTWERNCTTSHFPVNSNLKLAVASTLVDYLRDPNRDMLIQPTEEQAFDMAACLIQEVLPLSYDNAMVDPIKTFNWKEKYTMPDKYSGEPRTAAEVHKAPLPEHVLDAVEYITQILPARDSRRNMLANRLLGITRPPDSSWADVPEDEYHKPLITFDDINEFNNRLATIKQRIDNVAHKLLA